MKMTKWTGILALAFMMTTACDEEMTTPSADAPSNYKLIDISGLPQPIFTHVQNNFPQSEIAEAKMDISMGYEVLIDLGWELYYDSYGKHLHTEALSSIDNDIPVPVSSLPANILNYINQNFPNENIIWAEMDDDDYEVYLSDGIELYFDLNGNFLYADQDDYFDPANLPAAITNYINQNYPSDTIVKAELDDNIYEIYLSSGIELYFDINGTFIGLDDNDDYIDPANLPGAILTYVQQNYPNETIVEAELDDNIYVVELSSGIELYFDINGNFIGLDDDDYIDPANLIPAILTYVQQNYPNETIVQAELDDNMYVVELSNGTELYFDLNGNFLYADLD